ncbi:4-hydroxythreonine-4-phosphate dehydrogenase [Alteribacter lacisalsi]|uniref:4-hydroxythreonine-4-phosphate dehydrogenase n=1 Tax=Alteribacter lacisalsi TaxID=2045244 RepID=A0A2W0HGN6_9BACI|nr:4-hydroxythreonine-4-phosphate dehydrogenase PdxA [Alteribacter lacisalsi]PYZ95949.1 4-hydroxythreonine-4-phosphate dehydrogenase [Alteribacter lacisalsi]
MTQTKPMIGITLGDATGIGSELVVKSLQNQEILEAATWFLAGDKRVLRQGEEFAGMKLKVTEVESFEEVKHNSGVIYFQDLKNLSPEDYEVGTLSPHSGKMTGETLAFILKLAKEKKIDGVMYAPLNKEALHRGGHHFQDELHYFAELLECKEGFSEINVMDDLWVTRLTSHIPIKDVSKNITREKVEQRIAFAHDTLKKAGIANPKIVVSALNPHAGEGGMIGTEEIDTIIPAIETMKSKGYRVEGPYPADTLFLRLNKDPFDCLLAMYHDQAQTGMKMLGFNRGVTMSGGLPVTLTTPAHGTAFDIAGKGKADPGATNAAFRMVLRMSSDRKVKI